MSLRLSAAFEAGAVARPAGRVLLLRPPPDLSLDDLPCDAVAVTGFRPDYDALAARGVSVAGEIEGSFDAAVVFAARAKALTKDLIARAVAAVPAGAQVIVDGAKVDGIDSLVKACRAEFEVGEVFAKAHGKCFAFAAAPAPTDWRAEGRVVDGFETRAGTFSADGIDPGSALLAGHLGRLSGRVCDLGAGWGSLGRAVLACDAVTELACVEAEADALACARRNLPDPRATFHWADAATWSGGSFDVVVSNPPFHVGRRSDPDLGRAFLRAASRLLTLRGRFVMVANRHLPYEATLAEAFGESLVIADANGYKVIEASHPRVGPSKAGTPKRRRA